MRLIKVWMITGLVAGSMTLSAAAQEGNVPPMASPHAAGTVTATNATGLMMTTTAGTAYTVTVPSTAKIMVVAPGSKDLKSATSGSLSDVTPADRVIVTGTAGEVGTSLTAVRVILMKSQAIADTHAAEDAAWARGGGGIVKTVDATTGKIAVASGMKTLIVMVTPATIVRRYSGDSVRFADAQVSTIAAIQAGDQLRVRGAKSADGNSITADELVTGSFHNYSGLIASIDTSAGTLTLKDLTTKKTVTVAVTANSDVRRIPAMLAQRVAAGMKVGASAGEAGSSPAAAADDAAGGARRAGRAGMDLSQMLSRLPTERIDGLKAGDAVMIVSTSDSPGAVKSTAVTLLVGVDAILSASPSGQSMTLSPWSLGGGGEGGDAGGIQGGSSQHAATSQ